LCTNVSPQASFPRCHFRKISMMADTVNAAHSAFPW
jgi:hypothetical protein